MFTIGKEEKFRQKEKNLVNGWKWSFFSLQRTLYWTAKTVAINVSSFYICFCVSKRFMKFYKIAQLLGRSSCCNRCQSKKDSFRWKMIFTLQGNLKCNDKPFDWESGTILTGKPKKFELWISVWQKFWLKRKMFQNFLSLRRRRNRKFLRKVGNYIGHVEKASRTVTVYNCMTLLLRVFDHLFSMKVFLSLKLCWEYWMSQFISWAPLCADF